MRSFSCARRALPTASAVQYAMCGYATLPHLTLPAQLPSLPYDYKEGIAPLFSPRQMELHYTKHHKAYVDKLNMLAQEKEGTLIEDMMLRLHGSAKHKTVFNQAAQHFNHTFFWNCLTPNGTKMPSRLKDAICENFGTEAAFKEAFQKSGVDNFGSGWTWLCYDPSSCKLVIRNTSNAECPVTDQLRPIFTADVWEHAYYKDFENRRPDYLKELWDIVNWEYVGEMYEKAASSE